MNYKEIPRIKYLGSFLSLGEVRKEKLQIHWNLPSNPMNIYKDT